MSAGGPAGLKLNPPEGIPAQVSPLASYTIVNSAGAVSRTIQDYYCDSHLGGFTLTLSATPLLNERHVFLDIGTISSSDNVVISGNGNTFITQEGYQSNAVLKWNCGAIDMSWDGAHWVIRSIYQGS